MTKCTVCNDTGDTTGRCFYDCAAPGCTAAAERVALNAAVAAMPLMTSEDLAWAAYQSGVTMTERRHAVDVAELAAMVRKMWGWAVELDHDTGYFDGGFGPSDCSKADWQGDMLAGAALAKKYGK